MKIKVKKKITKIKTELKANAYNGIVSLALVLKLIDDIDYELLSEDEKEFCCVCNNEIIDCKVYCEECLLKSVSDEEIEEKPVLVGYLKKDFGYNGFEKIKKGSEVFQLNDRYFFKMKILNSDQVEVQTFYIDTLAPCINFIKA